MQEDRLLLDTSYFIAITSRSDAHHKKAMELMDRVESARDVVVTEAILVELGGALRTDQWGRLRRLIDSCYETPNVTVVPIDEALLKRFAGGVRRVRGSDLEFDGLHFLLGHEGSRDH